MTEKNIYRALGELDPVLVEKAAPEGKIKNNTQEKRRSYFNKRILIAAACLALAVSLILGGNHLYGLFNGQPQPPEGLQGNTETPSVGTYPQYNPSSGDETIPGEPLDEPDLNIQSLSLMTGMKSNDVTARNADEAFIQTQMILALKLFKAAVDESREKDPTQNVLISPLSIQLALAMTANGADGETRAEMEKLLGGNIPLEHLNEYLKTYTTNLPSTDKSKFNIANSIWFPNDEDRLTVKKDFLQTNADYYGAAAYKSAFNDQTVKDINNWVSENTDGMIEQIIDEINFADVMFLINAIVFDAEWASKYSEDSISDMNFYASNGVTQTVSMMCQMEDWCRYFVTDDAVGFFKDYKGGKYSFVGILPNENITLDDYVDGLEHSELLSAMRNAKYGTAIVGIPKFSYEYSLEMKNSLISLGMKRAFQGGDFSKLGYSRRGNLFISSVLHKTFIDVNENGTRAGAVTKVTMSTESVPDIAISITLDRPFLYMIVDNSTNLPIFIGTVNGIE